MIRCSTRCDPAHWSGLGYSRIAEECQSGRRVPTNT